MWARGSFGEYSWRESADNEWTAGDVVSALRRSLRGLYAVCASWDSGMLRPDTMGLAGWRTVTGHAVSDALTDHLIAAWPQSDCGFDEWYFFREVPALGRIAPFCNWGVSLAEPGALRDVPDGFNLTDQLRHYRPEVVVGDGHRVFIISRDAALAAEVEKL